MYKKIGLLILYILLIVSGLNLSSRAPIENPLTFVIIGLLVLVLMVVFTIRRRYRNR